MNTREILVMGLIALLLWSGCREITVTTVVNRNGTFTRLIRITGDSADVYNPDLPYPVDTSWAQEFKKDTASKKDYILTYSKTFSNSEELNSEICSDSGWRKHLKRTVVVSRHFGFFYSYLRFKEVFQAANPFTLLNYRDYLSPHDLRYITGKHTINSESDSTLIEEAKDKAELFLIASATAEIEQILKNGLIRLDDPSLNPATVANFHDSIRKKVEEWNFTNTNQFVDYYRQWTGDEAVSRLHQFTPPLFEEFARKVALLDSIFGMKEYLNVVEMPGMLTETNSYMLKGNQVSWEVQPMAILFTDYEMYLESRVVNNWAFVLTGIVILVLILVLVVKAVKKKRSV
ncbi:MAG: hypothetical protein V1733_09490 [bacterium]